MSAKSWVVVTAVVCLLAVMCAGCRTGGGDRLDPALIDELEGDHALSSWGDDPGRIVPDVDLENVLFDFDSARIRPGERRKLEAAARYLEKHPRHRMVVEGHCDERGSKEYNMALGERRALSARKYLISLGINDARLLTRSYGEESPAHIGHDESAWRLNRRAEFVVYR